MGFEDIKILFKDIEKKCGRTPEGKQKGIIPLDIDLLVFDMEVIKPADMEKNYVKQALNTLSEQVIIPVLHIPVVCNAHPCFRNVT